MLDTQVVNVSFQGGIDSKTDEKLVLPGRLTLLENGVFTKKSIVKRFGYDKLGSTLVGGGSLPVSQKIALFNNEMNVFGSNSVYSYSPSLDQWANKGKLSSVVVSNTQIARNSYQQSKSDMALNYGISVYAWADGRGGVRSTVIDTSTGSELASDFQLSASGDNPRCVAVNSYIFVFYSDAGNLRCRRYNPSTPNTFESEITIGSDLSAGNPYYDAVASGGKIAIVYRISASNKVAYVTDSGVVGSPVIGLPSPVTIAETADNCIALCVEPTNQSVYVFWHNNTTGTRYTVLNLDFTTFLGITTIEATTTPITLRIGCITSSTSTASVFYEVNSANTYDHFIKSCTVSSAGAITSLSVLKRSVGLASKPFVIGSTTYVLSVFDSVLQGTFFLLGSDGSIVAKMIPGQGGGIISNRMAPAVANPTSTTVVIPAQIKNKFVSEGNTTYTLKGVSQIGIDFASNWAYLNKQVGENSHIIGGYVSIYDGQSAVEHGFHVFPENYSAVVALSTGSIADGTYLYYAVYEWTDNKGQVQRSSPGVGLSVVVSGGGGAGKVTLTVPALRLTAKTGTRTNVVLKVYRTKAGLTTAYNVLNNASPTLIYNDPTTDTITFVDTSNDSTIGANEILYTAGGVLENISAPACSILDVYQNRMVLAGLEDKLTFWYSKRKVKGTALEFSDSFSIRVDPLGGDITAVKMMDDKIILFKENLIYYVSGDGPNDTGSGNNYTTPQLVTSDVGCNKPSSLVLVPQGIMFQSAKGFYLLDRQLNASYVGSDVEAYNSQTTTSSDLIEDRNQVRFLTSSGVTLVYDYFYQQWSTFQNHLGADADIWNHLYVYIRNDGSIYKENKLKYLDDNIEIRLRMATAWLKLTGIQNYQRVKRAAILGNYKTSHVLRMKVGYDYESTYSDVILFNAGSVINTTYYGQDTYYGLSTPYGGVESGVYQFRAHLRRQKCESIRFLFEDITAGTAGEGYSLSDLSLEAGVKRGLMKLKAQKSVG